MLGCNLPEIGFTPHFSEIYRTLLPGGRAFFVALASFGTIFTDGTIDPERLQNDIDSALEHIGNSRDHEVVVKGINHLEHVHRATFAFDEADDRWEVITDELRLSPEQPIYRKLPGEVVVPNYYHGTSEYEKALRGAGFREENIQLQRDRFAYEAERHLYNAPHLGQPSKQLGPEYVGNNPFVIFIATK